MNKTVINNNIGKAYEALAVAGIAEGGIINKTFRGQISSFGAAITMGSLLPAIAFFSDDGGSTTERSKLLCAICHVMGICTADKASKTELYNYVAKNGEDACKEDIINAAISIKLAMNLYKLVKDK